MTRQIAFLLLFGLAASAQTLPSTASVLPLRGSNVSLDEPKISHIQPHLNALGAFNIRPKSGEALTFGLNLEMIAVPLERAGAPNDLLYVYFIEKTQTQLFMHGRMNDKGHPELRLWSDGPSEIVITDEKMALEDSPGPLSFRLAPELTRSKGTNRALETSDVIRCIAQSLGITLDVSSIRGFVNTSLCAVISGDAKDAWSLLKTAAHCLSTISIGTATVVSTTFCVAGIAVDVACNLLGGCTTGAAPQPTPTTNCVQSIAANSSTSGSWTNACNAPHRTGSFAKLYTFTLSARSSVTINLRTSQNIDTYLYLLRGAGTAGTIIAEDDDGGSDLQSRITTTLDAGSYTIEATTYSPNITGNFGIEFTVQGSAPSTTPPPSGTSPSSCTGTVGLNSQLTGTWTTGCTSVSRNGRLARFYTLTLTAQVTAQIDLSSSTADTYLILHRGNTPGSSTVLETNDDGGPGTNSRIVRVLTAGTYTIECTTFSPGEQGSFALSVRQ